MAEYVGIKAEIEDLLNSELGVGHFLASLADGSGPATPSLLLGEQLSKSFTAFYSLREKLGSHTLDCAFLALTKSGKSTLLNAFSGASILPCNNVPETARIVSVEHTQLPPTELQQPCLTYKCGDEYMRVVGERNIRTQIEYLNKEVRGRQHRKEDENFLTVNIDIAALKNENAHPDVRLRLLDTPGPNEAGEDALRHQVERLLDSVDAVVYILDYTKLKTAEEALLLCKIREANPALVQRLAQRLFFVVNKVDQMYENDGLQEQELREYVAGLITSQLNTEAFQLKPEQVLLVSAQEALLSRLVLLDKGSAEDRRRFARRVWGKSLGRRSDAEYKAQAQVMFEESGLLELETTVLSYLHNHAGGVKLVALLDDVIRLLHEVQNVALTGQAALRQTAEQLEQESKELQEKLTLTLNKFGAVQTDADILEAEVIDSVQARMQTLKEKLFAYVNEVLDTSREPELPAVRTGRWRRVFEMAASFFRHGSGAQADSQTQLQATLQDLHNEINRQIELEIQEFWHELEVATNEKQQQMVGTINQHLSSLARDIEDVVGRTLDLRLEPVDIRMDPPTAQDFHDSLQQLFSSGIRQRTRRTTTMRTEEYVVWERRFRGLCRTTEYYVGRPARRSVPHVHNQVTYSLQPEAIKEYFSNMVSSTVDGSIAHVRGYVKAYMMGHIETAQELISSYGDRYAETMLAALTVKSQSAEEQEAGLRALQGHLDTVRRLLASSTAILQSAANLFPDACDAAFHWVPEMDPPSAEEAGEPQSSAFAEPTMQLVEVQVHSLVLDSAQEIDASAAAKADALKLVQAPSGDDFENLDPIAAALASLGVQAAPFTRQDSADAATATLPDAAADTPPASESLASPDVAPVAPVPEPVVQVEAGTQTDSKAVPAVLPAADAATLDQLRQLEAALNWTAEEGGPRSVFAAAPAAAGELPAAQPAEGSEHETASSLFSAISKPSSAAGCTSATPSLAAELIERAHSVFGADLGAAGATAPTAGSQLCASQHMEEFLRQVAKEHPEGPELPVSSDATSKLPSPPEAMSGGTSGSATPAASASKASSAVIPTDFHQHDGAEDLRESAILQVDSGEFDWEAIEEEEAADM